MYIVVKGIIIFLMSWKIWKQISIRKIFSFCYFKKNKKIITIKIIKIKCPNYKLLFLIFLGIFCIINLSEPNNPEFLVSVFNMLFLSFLSFFFFFYGPILTELSLFILYLLFLPFHSENQFYDKELINLIKFFGCEIIHLFFLSCNPFMHVYYGIRNMKKRTFKK